MISIYSFCSFLLLLDLSVSTRRKHRELRKKWYRAHHQKSDYKIDGTSIPKYVTGLYIVPVLHDDRELDAAFETAVRQFDSQVLPEGYPKTSLWGFGDPSNPESFHNPSGSMEVTKNRITYMTWRNELIEDPEACRMSNYTISDGACNYIPHIIQDRQGTPIIDQQVHWANPNKQCRNGQVKTDCEGNSADPYLGPVPFTPHVHGAHVESRSDGYAESWWLPKANNIPEGYGYGGTYFRTRYLPSKGIPDEGEKFRYNSVAGDKFFEPAVEEALGEGYSVYRYRNDEQTTALWYHDHTLGMTRLNVMAATAGFFFIRGVEDKEDYVAPLDFNGQPQHLPGPPPKKSHDPNDPSEFKKIREIGIVIQGRSFYKDGSMFYPASRAYFDFGDCNDGTVFADNQLKTKKDRDLQTDSSEAASDEEEGTGTVGVISNIIKSIAGIFTNSEEESSPEDIDVGVKIPNVPFLPSKVSDILPALNPEAFFDTFVVNGNTWPKLHVAPERYRFRLLNACDSRTLNLALFVLEENGELGNEVPFYVIGSDQGIVHHVIKVRTGFATILVPGENPDTLQETPQQWDITALLMGPTERMDAIVDLTGFPDGTELLMTNTGPDEPYGGFDTDDYEPADPDTTGQVMKFIVDKSLENPTGDRSTSPFDLVLEPKPEPPLATKTKDLALKETVSDICVIPEDGGCQLAYVNCSLGEVDPGSLENDLSYGPIIVEMGFDGSKGPGGASMRRWSTPLEPKDNIEVNSTQIWEIWNWTPDGHPIHVHLLAFDIIGRYDVYNPNQEVIDVQPWEKGQKDVVICYPLTVTRIRVTFDIGGYWMWHCHILSHEDNEMMLPFCIGEVGVDCPETLFE